MTGVYILLVLLGTTITTAQTCSAEAKCAQNAKCCAKLQTSVTGQCKTRCSGKTAFEIVFKPTTTSTTTLQTSTTTTATTSSSFIETLPPQTTTPSPIVCPCPTNVANIGINYYSQSLYTRSVSDFLPPGIYFNEDTCSIDGTPIQIGIYTFNITCNGVRCRISTNRNVNVQSKLDSKIVTCSITVSD
jgi:hypothetical protein